MRSLIEPESLEDAPKSTRRWLRFKYFVLVVLALGLFWGVSALGESKVVWQSDYPAALAEARRTNRPLLLDFWASWCPPCRLMDGRIFASELVAAAVHKDFIPVRIDLSDNDAETPAKKVARKFGVTEMPTLLIIDPATESIRTRPTGADEAGEGAFIKFLEKSAAK